ncbi:PQQ-dependent sugar dehydrogenase [Pontibacter sp. G13]|uniref:PQQ-dependent sugar dehydrogenase n=1 Tax=Pontibacter sp. G13 TaxID=3074898 RepID=UPI00288C03AE|nr:PQQ-dependent sugar dehydrogenase [Pontibacter sp. G13]WNJ19547.1 PQQ-dependent sugar dehydrogenase [Pontibacter sp. G13]
MHLWKISLYCMVLLLGTAHLNAQGVFVDELFMGGWNRPVTIQFDATGRMYVVEKAGRIWIVERNGRKRSQPLIDISEEVGSWRDFGLLGLALDPDFRNNGYIYLMYVVDRHHLTKFGTGAYNSRADEYYDATIGRITRYKANKNDNFNSVDLSSRKVLVGETISTGFPILGETHGIGTILFGSDGTLLASCGDGATATYEEGGSQAGSYITQALSDGILPKSHDVGSFRSQVLSSLNGKVIRIDPNTGDGIPSNPYYNRNKPRSAQSRTWAMGLRNPYRMTLKPGTGSTNPGQGNPGVLFLGDVGWGRWEEMNIVDEPGLNFGWPIYEGASPLNAAQGTVFNREARTTGECDQRYYSFQQLLADPQNGRPTWPDPCNPGQQIDGNKYYLFEHALPAFDWGHTPNGHARVRDGNRMIRMSSGGSIAGPDWMGNCSIGGVWYSKNDFPPQYRNVYFHADYATGWINSFNFNERNEPTRVRNLFENLGSIVFLGEDSHHEGFFYINYTDEIRRIRYASNGNEPPIAKAAADTLYTPDSELLVKFTGRESSDPDGDDITYFWDFGDGGTSTKRNPQHVFSAPAGIDTAFHVVLTVEDIWGEKGKDQLTIWVNNGPPEIRWTSLDNVHTYIPRKETVIQLNAKVRDDQPRDELTFSWQTVLFHNQHNHPEEPVFDNPTTARILGEGCGFETFWYNFRLTVTDPQGFSAYKEFNVYPDCKPDLTEDTLIYTGNQTRRMPILDNDQSEDGLDFETFALLEKPRHGIATFDVETGELSYLPKGQVGLDDSLTYTIQDLGGDSAQAPGVVYFKWLGAPTISITSPNEGAFLDQKGIEPKSLLGGDTTLVASVQYQIDGGPVQIAAPGESIQLAQVTEGARTLTATLLDESGDPLPYPSATATVNLEARPFGERMKIRWGKLLQVGAEWQTIQLDTQYQEMVVIASEEMVSSHAERHSVLVEPTGQQTFRVKVSEGPSDVKVNLHYVVVEAGSYTFERDGVDLQAGTISAADVADWQISTSGFHAPQLFAQMLGRQTGVFWKKSNPTSAVWGLETDLATQDRIKSQVGYMLIDAGDFQLLGNRQHVTALQYAASPDPVWRSELIHAAQSQAVILGVSDLAGYHPQWAGSPNLAGSDVQLTSTHDYAGNQTSPSHEVPAWAIIGAREKLNQGLGTITDLQGEWSEQSWVDLTWSWSGEDDASPFLIERSIDGQNFKQVGMQLPTQGKQSGAFEWEDHQTVAGDIYYRISRINPSGNQIQSEVARVNVQQADQVSVYPNPAPASEGISVEWMDAIGTSVEVQLFNVMGQEVIRKQYDQSQERMTHLIETSNLESGTYTVIVNGAGRQIVRMVVLMKK